MMSHMGSTPRCSHLIITCISLFIVFKAVSSDHNDIERLVLDLETSMEPAHKLVTVHPNSKFQFVATNISVAASFVLFQVHCQKGNVTMMYRSEKTYNSAVQGTSIGLVSYLKQLQKESSVFIANNKDKSLQCVLAVVSHSKYDPVPGGCNIEFNVPTSPFLHLYFTLVKMTVEYQSSNLGYKRSSTAQQSCDTSLNYVTYEFYVTFLKENSYDIEEYERAVSNALTWKSLEKNAQRVDPYTSMPTKRLFFSMFPGQGVIYNVVAKYTAKTNSSEVTFRSSYVPYVSYGCSFEDEIGGCYSINRTFTYIYLICAAIVGTLLCFSGHYFFKIEMFVVGFSAVSICALIFLIKFCTTWTHLDREIVTMLCGVGGGLIWLSIWWFFGRPVLSVLLAGFELGFLMSAIVLFTPIGGYDVFRSDFNYWMTFAIGILIVPMLLLYFTQLLSIIFCAVIGSFGIIVAVDRYIRATLSYIILNVIRRSIVGSLDKVNEVLPFQTNDIILCIVWIILSIIGIVTQHIITKNLPSFPECPYKLWVRSKERPRNPGQRKCRLLENFRKFKSRNNENSSLLDKDKNPSTYGSVY